MNFKYILFFLFIILCSSPQTCLGEWALQWSDEFDYAGLPDSNKWDYEEGFVRNEELQYYTRGNIKNARVENGMLVIEGRKEVIGNIRYKPNSEKWKEHRQNGYYTSASLISLNKYNVTQGSRIEIRAQVPHGKGVWPAIWTLGTNMAYSGYPFCGEIDIMEYFGKNPDQITSNIHYESPSGKRMSKPGKISSVSPYQGFHVYAIEWDNDRIDFFYDNIRYNTFILNDAGAGSENPFRKPHYLIINLALGGNSGGKIDDNILPQRFLVDYVRVYKWKNPR